MSNRQYLLEMSARLIVQMDGLTKELLGGAQPVEQTRAEARAIQAKWRNIMEELKTTSDYEGETIYLSANI